MQNEENPPEVYQGSGSLENDLRALESCRANLKYHLKQDMANYEQVRQEIIEKWRKAS